MEKYQQHHQKIKEITQIITELYNQIGDYKKECEDYLQNYIIEINELKLEFFLPVFLHPARKNLKKFFKMVRTKIIVNFTIKV